MQRLQEVIEEVTAPHQKRRRFLVIMSATRIFKDNCYKFLSARRPRRVRVIVDPMALTEDPILYKRMTERGWFYGRVGCTDVIMEVLEGQDRAALDALAARDGRNLEPRFYAFTQAGEVIFDKPIEAVPGAQAMAGGGT